jgi:hypothetical protein
VTFHFGPLRATAVFASEGAELTFGTLDSQAIAQSNREKKLPDQTTTQTLALGRYQSDQLMTTGIASSRRRNA